MRKIPSEYLIPGMIVGKSIYTIDGRLLLAKGVKLTNKYIERLISKEIPSIFTSDEISSDIVIDDVVLDNTRSQATKLIKDIMIDINKNSFDINMEKTNDIANDIIEQLLNNRDVIYNLADIRSVDNYLFGHCVNVCILSVMTGIAIGYNNEELNILAIGALLHDVGKSMVPYSIINKPDKLTKEEFDEIKKHPEYSLKILRNNYNIHSVSRMIAYQHHEKFNGEGYPEKLKGNNILDMAQIVGMVDMYDAITADRCYRGAMPPNEAYELIAGSGNYYFKFELVKSFLNQVAAYPTGSIVQLSSGEIAIVVETNKGFSLTPKIRIIVNADGSKCKLHKELNLFNNINIVISRIIKENEFKEIIADI